MALKGLHVLEFAGLAPGPFCGMILADHGARVIRVDAMNVGLEDRLCRGKRSIALNLKNKEGVVIVKKLSKTSDVLIEPYRPGVMEKLGIGPRDLMAENDRLIYARLTGYGQDGVMSRQAGHDINYVAMSGMLSRMGVINNQILPPLNFLADMAGGGMTCALGILMALYHRSLTGKGQVIDANMVEGAAYAGSFVGQTVEEMGILDDENGFGILDGCAHFYRTYKTMDNRYIAVGALEPKFYDNFLRGLEVAVEDMPQFPPSRQLGEQIEKIISKKSLSDWMLVFKDMDACVTPVLTLQEAAAHPHNKSKNIFAIVKHNERDKFIPNPAPRLQCSNNSDVVDNKFVYSGQHSVDILKEVGYTDDLCQKLIADGVVRQAELAKL